MSDKVRVKCVVQVVIPRSDLYPYDGSVSNEDYKSSIEQNPSGNLLDFAQYDNVSVEDVEVTDA